MKPMWPSHWVPPGRGLTALEIVAMVARELGTTTELMRGTGHRQKYTHGRAIINNALRERGLSYPQIAAIMKRDHSTIMHSCERLPTFLRLFPDLAPLNDRAIAAGRKSR